MRTDVDKNKSHHRVTLIIFVLMSLVISNTEQWSTDECRYFSPIIIKILELEAEEDDYNSGDDDTELRIL